MVEMNGQLLNAALRYADLAYAVFPCAPGDKTPLTPNGYLDASCDPKQIEHWWTQTPSANIGIAANGLIVVDIDGSQNPWLANQPERQLELAVGPMAQTPRGGLHHVFRRPIGKNWRCTASKLAPSIDTRTNGGYFVVAPSVRADGSAYRWVDGQELDVRPDQLPEPPAWLVQELDRLADGSLTYADAANGADGSNEIPERQRNTTLASLAGSMRRVGMSRSEIAVALHRANVDRCKPPLSTREVDRIAASIARYKPDEVAVAVVENHWQQMHDDIANEAVPENPDPGQIPDRLLHVPGFINEVAQYTLATAPYPEPVLAFAGALTLQAVLAGRKVRDSMDNRTNIYVLSLANSGVGKDHARKVNARILVEADLAQGLGTSFASGEGIEDRLAAEPATLFQVDEIDGLLLRVSQAKDARHEQIVSMLLQMYSSASTVYVMRAKASRDRSVIDQPCLCLFGTAVPKHFYESISARLMTNGFLARLLILECRQRGSGRDDTSKAIPDSILTAARWWADFKPGGNLAQQHPLPHLVPQSAEAQAVFREQRLRAESAYTQAERQNDPSAMAIWARAYEKARRLALIYACSENHDHPEIGRAAAEWAGEFIEHQTRRMLFMAARYSSESDFDAKRKRLLDVLTQWREQHGDQWMPFWKINRKLPWSGKEHEEIRNTLMEQRLIEYAIVTTCGRPGATYRLTTGGKDP